MHSVSTSYELLLNKSQYIFDLFTEKFKDEHFCKLVGQVPNLLHEIAKIFELISEQFILVLPNVYSRSDEHGLGLLDHLTLIFGSTVRSPQPNFLPGKK